MSRPYSIRPVPFGLTLLPVRVHSEMEHMKVLSLVIGRHQEHSTGVKGHCCHGTMVGPKTSH